MSRRSTASPPLRSTIGIMVSPFGRELRTQPSGGRMTQNSTPLLRPTCRGAQTWAPPSGATTLLIVSVGTGTHSSSTLTS